MNEVVKLTLEKKINESSFKTYSQLINFNVALSDLINFKKNTEKEANELLAVAEYLGLETIKFGETVDDEGNLKEYTIQEFKDMLESSLNVEI